MSTCQDGKDGELSYQTSERLFNQSNSIELNRTQTNHSPSQQASLRSKRSRTTRTKFGPRKNWGESKKVEGGGRGGERRERLPANPSILKNPFAHERGS